jgi:O-antigen ligase
MLLGAGCLPLVLVFFAGRMTTISTDEGTGQTRIQLWSDGLMFFQYSPLFGIGMENYRQFSSHVAHHSFIHSYAELGMIGGTLFLGAFYFAIRAMFALRNPSNDIETDAELRRIHPFLMGMLIAYAVGICFLSRGYIVPTYMVLGVTVVFLRLHATKSTVELPKWTLFGWPKLTGVSCCFLAVSFVFVRMFVKW